MYPTKTIMTHESGSIFDTSGWVRTDSTVAFPPKNSDFRERTVHGCSTRGSSILDVYSCLQRAVERLRRDGKGHRISGDMAGAWFQDGDFVKRKVGRSAVARLWGIELLGRDASEKGGTIRGTLLRL